MVRRQKDIDMVKRAAPKVVLLPKGKRFAARYKKETRASLTANVTLNRTYKQRASPQNRERRRQTRTGIGSLIKNVIKNLKARKPTKKVLN